MTFNGNAQVIRSDGTKECSKCGCRKLLCDFHIASKEKSGYKSACKACVKIEQAEYYLKNKPRIDEKNKKWALDHPERMRGYYTQYRLRNSAMHLKRVRDWQSRNSDKVISMKSRWRRETLDQRKVVSKRWLDANPGVRRKYDAARRSREKQAGGVFTSEDWLALFFRQNGRCAGCGCVLSKSAAADHVVPLVRGGGNEIGNRQLMCKKCNSQKHTKDMEQFLRLKKAGLI